MKTFSPQNVASIAQYMKLGQPPSEWKGVDAVWALLERMKRDGAVVLIKLDGQRTKADDTSQYTVVVSGPPLGERLIRTDATTIEEALCHAIGNYAESVWEVGP